MSALSDYLEQNLLNFVFNNNSGSITAPTTYVALFTSDPTDAASGDEVSGGSYAREIVNENGGSSPTWDAAAVDAPGYKVANTHDITFTTATAAWGTVTHFGIFDAETSGNLLFHGALDASKAVGLGDTFKFLAGDLVLRLE